MTDRQIQCPRCKRPVTRPTRQGFRINKAVVDNCDGRWMVLRCTHRSPYRKGNCGGQVILDLNVILALQMHETLAAS